MTDNTDIKSEDQVEKIRDILTSQVPSYLQKNGCYGNKRLIVTNCNVDLVSRSELAFHGASVIYSAGMELEEQTGDEICRRVYNLLVKTMPAKAFVRVLQNSQDQFYNEAILYSDIAKVLLKMCSVISCDNLIRVNHSGVAVDFFSKCFYASHENGTGLIALEDLRISGYKIGGNDDMIMDYDHILLTVRKLAVFHALSYAAKKKNVVKFEQRVSKVIKDSRRFLKKIDYSNPIEISYIIFIRHTTALLLDRFLETEQENVILYREQITKLKENISDIVIFDKLLKFLVTPEEPFAVLCHGDFNMNNMLFKYDSNNQPIGVKFVDFQNIRYCSPMIDLSFFLYMNSKPELRAEHWDDIFKTYHSTLLSALSEFTNYSVEELVAEYSLEKFQKEFAKYCIYGFLFASNFVISNSYRLIEENPFDNMKEESLSGELFNEMMKKYKIEREDIIQRLFPLVKEVLQKMQMW